MLRIEEDTNGRRSKPIRVIMFIPVKAYKYIRSRQKCIFKRSSRFIRIHRWPKLSTLLYSRRPIDRSSFLRKIVRSIPPRNLKLESCLLMRETKNISYPFRNVEWSTILWSAILTRIETSKRVVSLNECAILSTLHSLSSDRNHRRDRNECLNAIRKIRGETRNISYPFRHFQRRRDRLESKRVRVSTIDWDLGVSFQTFQLVSTGKRLYACGRDERVSAGIRVYRRGTGPERGGIKANRYQPFGGWMPVRRKTGSFFVFLSSHGHFHLHRVRVNAPRRIVF